MNKINNKKITFGLETMAILALATMITPMTASAQYYYGYGAQYGSYSSSQNSRNNPSYEQAPYIPNNNQNYYPNYYQTPIYISEPIYIPTPAVTPTVYSNSVNTNATTAPKTVAKAKTTSPANTSAAKTKTSADSNLAASAVFASNSFMPSSLLQWIFFAILVLIAVILTRNAIEADKNYHAIPMKHK